MYKGICPLCLYIGGDKCVFLDCPQTKKSKIEFLDEMAIGLFE
jgi:hypothetical protein